MANLTTTAPTKPGIYIGKLYRNQTGPAPGFRRYPNLVAKGSRYKMVQNAPIRRSYVTAYALTFTTVSPNTALLAHDAVPDQTLAQLYSSNGTVVPTNKWAFQESVLGSGNFDTIYIRSEVFDVNTSYLIDYQSNDRALLDPLPFSDLRLMRAVGDYENQSKYIEGENYAVPVDITTPDPAVTNTHSDELDHDYTPVTAGGKNSGALNPIANSTFTAVNTGTLVAGDITVTSPALTHNYNRRYRLVTGSVASPFTMYLVAEQNSGGLDSKAQVPLAPTLDNSLYPAGMTDVATSGGVNALSFTDPEIGETITLDVDMTTHTPAGGDSFLFTALGHSFIEVDASTNAANQWAEYSAVVPDGGNTGTGVVALRTDAYYTATHQATYRLIATAVTGGSPGSYTATFLWSSWGELPVTTGTFTIDEALASNDLVTLSNGTRLALTCGASNFAVGDVFEFTASPARRYISAKDSRNYTFTVATATAGSVTGQYVTDTFEGRFGPVAVTGAAGEWRLPGDINLWIRNIGTTSAQNRYAADDVFTWSTTDEEVVDWSLTARVTETIPVSSVGTDVLGNTTGTVGAPFVILSNTPTSIVYVRDATTGAIISTATLVSGKPVLQLASVPSASIEVRYEYIGPEPSPGSTYYVSANILRPLTDYNKPIFYSDYDEEAAPALGPSATDNDALIGAQIVLKDNGATGVYVTQVYNANQDGVYSTLDYNNAIDASMQVTKNTDLIVLGKAETLPTQMVTNEAGNDPFRDRVNMALWVGMPLGSVIGDIDTAGSVVFTAKRTLQLPVESQARGTRVLIANWEARKTIQLFDTTSVTVTLDGSFIAAAIAAKNASFTDPNTLLLNQTITGFDYIRTFSDDEILRLVAAQAVYVTNEGSVDVPVYKLGEGVTIDPGSDDLREINVAINVRTFTQADMRAHLNATIIGLVPDSAAAGVAAYRTQIVLKLADWVVTGITAQYEDSSGAQRSVDPNTDVQVSRNKTRKTQYFFKYAWFGKYGSTRGFGLYVVDSNDFGSPV